MKWIRENFSKKFQLKDRMIIFKDFDKTTKSVTEFYDEAPFPNYDDMETKDDLVQKILQNNFNKNLKDFIGFNRSFLEVGSGTCQLSLALAIGTNNDVVALDPTMASLKLGQEFAQKNNINNVTFINASLFQNVIADESFDVVWCSGVLHHTYDSKLGFETLIKWAKKDGIVFIGLYNTYGRLRTNFRQFIFNCLGRGKLARATVSVLDPVLRKTKSKNKFDAWFQDQYEHPVERKHSIDEVLNWFDENNVEFLGSLPNCKFGEVDDNFVQFDKNRSTFMSRVFAQLDMLFQTYGSEGGLFIMVGRKK